MKKKFKKCLVLLLVFSLFINLFACNVNNNVSNETTVDITTVADESENATSVNDVAEIDLVTSVDAKIENENNNEIEKVDHEEGKYPIHWDLSQIYNNIDEWNEDYKKIENYIATISDLRGTINNADGIYNFILADEESDIPLIYLKLSTYVYKNKDLDTVIKLI